MPSTSIPADQPCQVDWTPTRRQNVRFASEVQNFYYSQANLDQAWSSEEERAESINDIRQLVMAVREIRQSHPDFDFSQSSYFRGIENIVCADRRRQVDSNKIETIKAVLQEQTRQKRARAFDEDALARASFEHSREAVYKAIFVALSDAA